MTLTVIPGNPMKDKGDIVKQFVEHIRFIESSMADAKRTANKIGWDELYEKMKVCHSETTKILKYVKDVSKKLEKETPKPMLQLVSNRENRND